jgi:hypothetical protein
MPFTEFLKKLLTGFVEVYERYFRRTFLMALILSFCCFALVLILMAYTSYDENVRAKPNSILSFFFSRYSFLSTYRFVDLTKTVFVFFTSIFSISIIRSEQLQENPTSRFPFKATIADVFSLFWVLIACIFVDCAFFRFDGQILQKSNSHGLYVWVHAIIFQLRIYLPLLIFSLIIQIRTSKTEFTAKKILFLLLSLWICNEVSYEFTIAVRGYLFDLVLFPVTGPSAFFVSESTLGVGLIAILFQAFYYAMCGPFKLLDE